MILYVLRVAWLLLRQSLKSPVRSTETFDVSFRAWPWYCDTNLHLNNAYYLTFMEYARWAFAARSGMIRRTLAERAVLLIGGASVLYRRPLPLLRRFTVRTRLVSTDERWAYISHEFIDHRGQVAARGLVRGMARNKRGAMTPADIFGQGLPQPEATAELEAFDALTREHLRQVNS